MKRTVEWLSTVPRHFVDALTGETARRLDSIDERLRRLDGPSGHEGTVGDLVKKVEALDRPKLEDESPGIPVSLNFFNFFVICLAVITLIGGGIFFYTKDIAEYMSYTIPIFAGLSAGAGLYGIDKKSTNGKHKDIIKKQNIRSFEASVVLLGIGLLFFITSKEQIRNALFDIIGFLGLLISLVLFHRNRNALKNNPTIGDKRARYLVDVLLGLSIAMAAVWLFFICTNPPGWGIDSMLKGLENRRYYQSKLMTPSNVRNAPINIDDNANKPGGEFQSFQNRYNFCLNMILLPCYYCRDNSRALLLNVKEVDFKSVIYNCRYDLRDP